MIDFPASPTDGQVFSATNGVVYKWSATYTSWLAQNPAPPLGGTGDVTAYPGSAVQNNGTPQVVTFSGGTVVGNAGAWLNLATGRYTPPAGRYFLQCSMSTQAPIGGNGTWSLNVRKNGATLTGNSGSGSASFAIPITVGMDVDANGADYFDFVSVQQAAGMNSQGNATFTAFPLTGMQGPTGPVNSGGQIIRDITLAAPAPTIDLFNLGPAYKTIEIFFAVKPVTDAVGIYLRTVRGAVVDSSATYYSLVLYGSGTTPGFIQYGSSSAYVLTASASNVAAGGQCSGKITFPALAGGIGNGQYYVASGGGGTPNTFNSTFLSSTGADGLQFSLQSGNFQAGSFARVIGWP